MSEELQLTRRGVLHMMGAIITMASFAARRPLFASTQTISPLDTTMVEDAPFIADRAHGSRLEYFLRSRGIKPAHLARESGYSRQFLLRLRLGRVAATSRCIVSIVLACRRLAREPVAVGDLFELSAGGLRVVDRLERRLIE